MSQNAPDTLAETAGTATAYKITATKGATTVALSNVTSSNWNGEKRRRIYFRGLSVQAYCRRYSSVGAVESVAIDPPLHKRTELKGAFGSVSAEYEKTVWK